MANEIGQLEDREPDFLMGSGDEPGMELYVETPLFPEKAKKRGECVRHMMEGALSEAVLDFQLGGCTYPEGDDEAFIRVRPECKGSKRFGGGCALQIVQYNREGAPID